MSEISDEILKRGAADSDITAFRDECFSAWTTYRDAMEDAGEWADITDYRTGFFVGVCAGLNAHATLTDIISKVCFLLGTHNPQCVEELLKKLMSDERHALETIDAASSELIDLTEQLAEAKGKVARLEQDLADSRTNHIDANQRNLAARKEVERFEAMLGAEGAELVFETRGQIVRIFRGSDGWKYADRWGNTIEELGSYPGALTAFEAIQEGRDG